MQTRIALVGCGYVGGFYARTMGNHKNLAVAGVYDPVSLRAKKLAEFLKTRAYRNLNEAFLDKSVKIILNLTPPDVHASVTTRSLEAGKHVYSEKPFSSSFRSAQKIVRLAKSMNLVVASAPSTVLGGSAQTIWRALKNGLIGKVRLAYAELDDGPIFRMEYKKWKNPFGVKWPYKSEFATGSVKEHATYPLSWLLTLFGPVSSVTAFSTNLLRLAPGSKRSHDFAVAVLMFRSGVIARLTCGSYATRNRGFTIHGDHGYLAISDCWHSGSRVEHTGVSGKTVTLKHLEDPNFKHHCGDENDIDYARGVSELADAVNSMRECRLGPDFILHVMEILDAIIHSPNGRRIPIETTFRPSLPMPWAES